MLSGAGISPWIILLIILPLLASLTTGIFLSVLIFRRLRRERVTPREIIDAIRALRPGGNTETLTRLCVRNDSALARLVNSCLEHSSLPRGENVEVLQTAARTEALHTTVFGIGTAIVMLFPFTFFSKKVDVLAVEMEDLSMLLLKKLYTEEVPA